MPELLLSIPLAILIILACHEAGRLTLLRFNLNGKNIGSIEAVLLRLAVGYILVEFILSILGHAHLLYSWVFWILLIGLLASAVVFGKESIRESANGFRDFFHNLFKLRLNGILAVVAILALLMDFVLTCTPTTAWDALTYHYPLPAMWLSAGYFKTDLGICYSELPCGSEMLFMFAFGLGGLRPDNLGIGHLAANHLTWATGLFACIALVVLSRRLGSIQDETSGKKGFWDTYTPGLIAVVAFLSLPIVYVEEMEGGYIENFLVFLSLVMLVTLLRFKESKSQDNLLLIGILAGGLLASKHTSVLLNALVLVILIVWIVRSKSRSLFTGLGFAILLTLIIPFPWYLKSSIHTGDPAWPLLSFILHPDDYLPDIMYWSNPNVDRSVLGFITYIFRLSWDESLTQFKFRLLSWYFLPLLPFAIWWSIHRGKGRIVGLVAWVLILLIYLLAPGEPRYMLAAWGLYAALGAWGLLFLLNKIQWSIRWVLPILLITPIGMSVIDRTREVNHRIPTIIGAATVDEYFEKSLDIWPLIKYINEETEPNARIAVLDPRIFYIHRYCMVLYPFPTPAIRLKYGPEFGHDFLISHGIGYILLTYGPNYRALAVLEINNRYWSRAPVGTNLLPELPAWIFRRASYAEEGLTIRHDGLPIMPVYTDRYGLYDVSILNQLYILHYLGYLEPIFVDERSGSVFRVIDPLESEIEEDGS